MRKFQEIFTLSNLLSLLRLLLSIPIYIYIGKLQESPDYRVSVIILSVIAAATDFFDGYFARKFNQITEIGKIIDPLADKVLIIVIVWQLFWMKLIPDYYFYAVASRDILIFLGGIVVSKKIGRVLPSNLLGKITVTFISIYLFSVIIGLENSSAFLSKLLLYFSLILVFASFIGYAIRAKESLVWNKNESIQEH
jgi:CDP-diacylglycerol--glycerol-3-phosphate 3-phosphatidyltransferase